MSIDECFAVLGLRPDASWQEIRRARKKLATYWHPDRFAHDPRLREEAERRVSRINSAFILLKEHFESVTPQTSYASSDVEVEESPVEPTQSSASQWRAMTDSVRRLWQSLSTFLGDSGKTSSDSPTRGGNVQTANNDSTALSGAGMGIAMFVLATMAMRFYASTGLSAPGKEFKVREIPLFTGRPAIPTESSAPSADATLTFSKSAVAHGRLSAEACMAGDASEIRKADELIASLTVIDQFNARMVQLFLINERMNGGRSPTEGNAEWDEYRAKFLRALETAK